MGRKIPLWLLLFVLFISVNVTIVFGYFVLYAKSGGSKLGRLGPIIITIAQYPTYVRFAFLETFGRSPQLIDNRFPEIDGFKKKGVLQEGARNDDGYLLLSAYNNKKKQSTVQLISISDQQVLHEWVPNIQKLADVQKTESKFFYVNGISPSRYRIHNPVMFSDGSLVFGHEGPLFKINACSNIETVINGLFHHSIELDADGNIWTSSVIEPSSYKAKFADYRDDAIAKISTDGKLLHKKSVSKILEENGYRGLVFGVGNYHKDAIHLNDVQPALYSTKYWQKGDLLLSMRNLSTVMLYRPSTNKILWIKTGPWLKQHDVNFVGQSKISIFGNDVVDDGLMFDTGNNFYLFDFSDGSISTPFSEASKKLYIRTSTQGRMSVLENGDIFIEETVYGRILRISQKNAIWEYTVKVDENTVAMLGWSRYMTKKQVENVLPVLAQSKCR